MADEIKYVTFIWLSRLPSITCMVALKASRPCGLMDKALVLGTKDCRFESCQGHVFMRPSLSRPIPSRPSASLPSPSSPRSSRPSPSRPSRFRPSPSRPSPSRSNPFIEITSRLLQTCLSYALPPSVLEEYVKVRRVWALRRE